MHIAITIGCARTSQDMIELQDQGDHIYTVDGAFDDHLIDEIIHNFDRNEELGLTLERNQYTGRDYPTMKDTSMFATRPNTSRETDAGFSDQMKEVFEIINGPILDEWLRIYPVLQSKNYRDIYVSNGKMQKTYPGGGYHNWHSEHCNQLSSMNTLLAWMIYLNDVEEGGETEFLYQQKRLEPQRNRFVLWPAGFTHLHRGNPPLQGVKYVLTGWIHWI